MARRSATFHEDHSFDELSTRSKIVASGRFFSHIRNLFDS